MVGWKQEWPPLTAVACRQAKEEASRDAVEATARENAALRAEVLELKGALAMAERRHSGAEARFEILQTQIAREHEEAMETLRASLG